MSFQISFNDIKNSLGISKCWEVYQLRVHSEAWQHYERIGNFESYIDTVEFMATLDPKCRYESCVEVEMSANECQIINEQEHGGSSCVRRMLRR